MSNTGVFLDQDQLRRLPSAARSAILALIVPSTDESTHSAKDDRGLTPLTRAEVSTFMSGVNEKSAELLRAFAKYPSGSPLMSELMKVGDYTVWQHLRGFLAGVTKRARTVTGDPKAKFWHWEKGQVVKDAKNGDWDDGPFFLHATTLQSLRQYFKIS